MTVGNALHFSKGEHKVTKYSRVSGHDCKAVAVSAPYER